MNEPLTQIAIVNLYRQHSYLMQEYAECIRRDDIFQIKRALLSRMREIEKEIKKLENKESVFQMR